MLVPSSAQVFLALLGTTRVSSAVSPVPAIQKKLRSCWGGRYVYLMNSM